MCESTPSDRSADDSPPYSEVVAFLSAWLPPEVKRKYRELIALHPDDWTSDPHFTSGSVIHQIFRGNGITEKSLQVDNLDEIWPELLARAVAE